MAFAHTRHSTHENLGTSSTTVAVTLASTVASGSLIFVSVGWASSSTDTVTQIRDDKTNTYTLVDLLRDPGAGYSWQTAYLDGVSNGPVTITATLNASVTFATIVVGEYTGSLGGASINGHVINCQPSAGTAANGVTSGSFTPTVNNSLIYGTTANASSLGGVTAGTGFTLRLSNFDVSFDTEDKTLAVAAATAATFTCSSDTCFLTGGIAIKPAGSISNKFVLRNRQAIVRAAFW